MRLFRNIFRKKQEANPLRIEGVAPAPITPEPDDAEMAATALLEKMGNISNGVIENDRWPLSDDHSAAYYNHLAERIRRAYAAANMRTSRFIAFCEQELNKRNIPKEGPDSLLLLEAGLYKRIDVIEREKGELKKRWQHCLAEVTVRLMEVNKE